ncbi:hypothetical protein DFH06DRAFT_1239368 [Mycena polygramma]|nr:hypothetical protein DFH06DRAFT_1239368 [Mycena polygramma]
MMLGNYKHVSSLYERARHLLLLTGQSHGSFGHQLMVTQAEVHRLKSEYNQAANINSQILRDSSAEKDLYNQAIALLNLAEIDVSRGARREDIEQNTHKAKTTFTAIGDSRLTQYCDVVQANLLLREGNITAAQAVFQKCLKLSWGKYTDIVSLCLESLSHPEVLQKPMWTITFLAFSLWSKEKLGIYKGLELLGDVFISQGDESTAASLFTVALDGFTIMGVHRSRAECMLRLGDISKRHGDMLKAVGHWREARPLFEMSCQVKEVEEIGERLEGVGQDVLHTHAENLARLAELSASSNTVDESDDD